MNDPVKSLRAALGEEPLSPAVNAALLGIEAELRRLRLELEEQRKAAAAADEQAALRSASQQDLAGQALRDQFRTLVQEAAGPVVQLLVQQRLAESGSAQLRLPDVLQAARRLVGVLQQHGLEPFGQVGELAAFDPDRHLSLNAQVALEAGEPVLVRLPGIAFQGEILRKAGVSPPERA